MNFKVVLRVLSFVSLIITGFMLLPLAIALFSNSAIDQPENVTATSAFWESLCTGLLLSALMALFGGNWRGVLVDFKEYFTQLFNMDWQSARLALKGVAKSLWGGEDNDLGMREGVAIVSLAWVIASVVGALPYLYSGVLPSFPDAFFETMSGFTTTGATVMTDIEAAPDAILFWRGLTHWLGGMGIIVLSLVLIPLLGLNGMALYRAEVPGPSAEKLTPRLQRTAIYLWGLYALMTALETIFLTLGGMSLFEAVIHSFSTIATGGFSTRNASVAAFNSPYIEWVLIFFMFAAGVNFAIYFHVLRRCVRGFKKLKHVRVNSNARAAVTLSTGKSTDIEIETEARKQALRYFTSGVKSNLHEMFTNKNEFGDEELHGYGRIVLFAAFLVAYCLYFTPVLGNAGLSGLLEEASPFFHNATESIRTSLFHVVSLITTTGFVADDYALWPQFAQFLLLLIMVIGACGGSTGGGCKVVRFQMLSQQIRMEIHRMLHPRIVTTARFNDKPTPHRMIESTAGFLMLYLAILVFATLAIMAIGVGDARLDITASFSGVIACLSNVGPGLASLGPTANFSWLHWGSKLILSLCMLVGRLELFAVLLLFIPSTWKK